MSYCVTIAEIQWIIKIFHFEREERWVLLKTPLLLVPFRFFCRVVVINRWTEAGGANRSVCLTALLIMMMMRCKSNDQTDDLGSSAATRDRSYLFRDGNDDCPERFCATFRRPCWCSGFFSSGVAACLATSWLLVQLLIELSRSRTEWSGE